MRNAFPVECFEDQQLIGKLKVQPNYNSASSVFLCRKYISRSAFAMVRLEIIHASRIRCQCLGASVPRKASVNHAAWKRPGEGQNPKTQTEPLYHVPLSSVPLLSLQDTGTSCPPWCKKCWSNRIFPNFSDSESLQKHFQVENSVLAQWWKFCGRKGYLLCFQGTTF